MKKTIISAFVAIATTFAVSAQNIAVVSESGGTEIYQSLDDAITGATDGAVIYLPGGGFQVKDETKITNRVTIVGVSYRSDADNADGGTIIAGNLHFNEGSSGSSMMGVYLSGKVNVATDGSSVTNLLIRYCDVRSIEVNNQNCSGMVVDQCFVREYSNFGYTNVNLHNSVIHSFRRVVGGVVDHNIITSKQSFGVSYWTETWTIYESSNTIITNNILIDPASLPSISNGCVITNNCHFGGEWGEECVFLPEGNTKDDVFENPKPGVSPNASYKLKDGPWKTGATDGKEIGIYGGTGFNENKSMVPIPRIVSKTIPEQTDGSGNLSIKITVKAN